MWTNHALARLIERYPHHEFDEDTFNGIVPQIEEQHGAYLDELRALQAGYRPRRVLVAVRYTQPSGQDAKLKLVYSIHDRVVITVLPKKITEPEKIEHLPRLRLHFRTTLKP